MTSIPIPTRAPAWRVALAAAAILLAACDSPEERLAEHYERGVELAEAGEPEKAMLEFRNALELDEAHVPSLFAMARALEATGNLKGAVGRLSRVAEVEPEHVEARIKLSQAMLLTGELERAREHAEAAYAVAPENADVLAAKAAVDLRLDNVAEALETANLALALEPDHASAGMILIAERIAAGDRWEALALIDRFLEAHPKNLPLNLVKLQLLEQDTTHPEALRAHLERLIGLYPEELAFHVALARLHQDQGDTDAALAVMREMAALDRDNPETVMRLVQFLAAVEGHDAARRELEARIAAAEDAEDAFPYHVAVAQLDLADGDKAAAEARFDRLIEEEGLASARVARARLHLADGAREKASALVEEVLEEDAKHVDALAIRAALQIDAENPDAAVLTLRAALAEAPDRADLLRLAAAAHERIGSPELAGEHLAAAVRASAYEPDLAIAYARFLRQREQAEAAADVLEKALEHHPDDRDLLIAAAEIRLSLGDWAAAEAVARRLEGLGDESGRTLAKRITAAALGAQGRLAETIEILRSVAAGPGDRGGALVQLVRSYVRADRADDAAGFLESILEDNPKNETALVMRGALHALADEPEKAAARYREAIAAAPESAGPRLALVRFLAGRDRDAEARAELDAGIETIPSPADGELRLALGALQEAEGDYAAAIETYRALYDDQPDSLVVANNLASLLSDHRADDPESRRLAVQVARRLAASRVPQFQDTYGWTLYLAGDHEDALRTLRQAVEALPENPWVHFHVGQTYAALGQAREARTHLERARELGGESFPRRGEITATLAALDG